MDLENTQLQIGEYYYYKYGSQQVVIICWQGRGNSHPAYDYITHTFEGHTNYLTSNEHIEILRRATFKEKGYLTTCMIDRGMKVPDLSVENYAIY